MIKLLSTIPLPPKIFLMFPQRVIHNIIDLQSQTHNNHQEITVVMSPTPLRKQKAEEAKNYY